MNTTISKENSPLVVIIYGDATRAEFASILDDFSPHDTIIHCKNNCAAKKNDADDVDVVFFLQSFSGEFSQQLVETQRCVTPLAPLVVICGAWCEGEERTGTPLAGVARFYTAHWKFIARAELNRLRSGNFSLISLPITSGEDERAIADSAINANFTFSRDKQISITLGESSLLGVDATMTEMLFNFFSHRHYRVSRAKISPAQNISAQNLPEVRDENKVSDFTILDVAAASHKVVKTEVANWTHPKTRLILLMHNPRCDEVETFHSLGATAVFPKPFSLFSLDKKILSLI